jgi:hypothetical protein
MSKCDLTIELDRPNATYARGETVRGHVRVAADQAVQCRSLTVTCQWRTHGRGNRCTGEPVSVSVFEGDWQPGEYSYPFELPAPTSPATYHGNLLNIDHYVTARADVPWSIDPKAEVELLVAGGDSPDYDFGSEYQPPDAEIRASAKGTTTASWLLGGCFGLPGLAIIVAGIGMLINVVVNGRHDLLFGGIFMSLFGIPFAAVGFGLLFVMQKRKLAQRRLGTPLTKVSPNPARPGERVNVQVLAEPNVELTLEGGHLRLIGRESVVSGSGTNRTTHKYDVYQFEHPLALDGRCVQAGETLAVNETLTIPEDAAPTFVASDNELKWTIHIRLGIKGWPDWEQEYPLTVRPQTRASRI